VARDGVVLALEGERPVGHQPLDDGDALLETVQAHAGRVVGHARAFVVAAHPPGTQAELEPTVGEQVDRGRLLRQHEGMAVVVVEHERADA